jgi:hypothetical protein
VLVEKYQPRAARDATIPAEPPTRSFLRPAQSSSRTARAAKTN